MASKGQPLGIGLAVDFASLDADLSKVADHIENVGKKTSLKIGTFAGMASKGELNADEIAAQVAMVGTSLSQGMASGVRISSALMLAFGARINAMLDRVAGVTVTMFSRIDAAIKGTRWTNLGTGLSAALTNFVTGAGKKLTPLDKALKGSFGSLAKTVAQVFNQMFLNLSETMTKSMDKAAVRMGKSMIKPANTIKNTLKRSLDSLADAFKSLAGTMEKSMSRSLDAIAAKLKNVSVAAKATTSATVRSMKDQGGVTIAKVYPGQARDLKGKRPPRSEKELGRMGGRFDMSLFDPKDLAPALVPNWRKPQKFTAAPAGPVLPARFVESPKIVPHKAEAIPKPAASPSPAALKPYLDSLREISARLGKIPTLFAPLEGASGKVVAAWRQMPAPIQAAGRIASRMAVDLVKFGADVANIGVKVGVAVGTTSRFMSTLGGVGGKTYASLFEGQRKWITLLGLTPTSVAANVLVKTGRAAIWLGRTLTPVARYLSTAFGDAVGSLIFRLTGVYTIGLAVAKILGSIHMGSLPVGVYFLAAKGLQGLYNWFTKAKDGSHGFANSLRKSTQEAGVLGRSVTALAHPIKTLGTISQGVGVQMLAAFGVVGVVYKLVEFFRGGVKGAATLSTEIAHTDAVFGDFSKNVTEQAEHNTKTFKISTAAQLDAANAFGSMAQGAGVSEQKSASLANELNALAVDAIGIGVSFEEATDAMKTGLSGRGFQLKQLAVNIDENTTKTYAWKTGIAAAGSELTNQQKLMAHVGQIMRGMSYVQGALTRNAGMAAVQFRMAGGGVALFAEKLGEIMMPALQAATGGFNELLEGVLDLVQRSGPKITAWAENSARFVGDVIKAVRDFGPVVLENLNWAWEQASEGPFSYTTLSLGYIGDIIKGVRESMGVMVRNIDLSWEIVTLKAGEAAENTVRIWKNATNNFSKYVSHFKDQWKNMLRDSATAFLGFIEGVKNRFQDAGEYFLRHWHEPEFKMRFRPILTPFEEWTKKLPEDLKVKLISVANAVAAITNKITKRELNLPPIKPPPVLPPRPPKKPPLEEEIKQKAEYKLSGALESGSKEAYSALARGAAGGGKNTTTAAVKEGVAIQRNIHTAIVGQTRALTQVTDAMKAAAKMPLIQIK